MELCKIHEERMKNIEERVDECHRNLPELLSFKNRLLGFFVLLTMVIGGGFTYTYFAHADIDIINNEHGEMKTNIAITNERYQTLNKKLDKIDKQLDELIKIRFGEK